MKKPKLTTTLIVPVYNEEKYIPGLIESVRKSALQPDEILFCDNNSSDASVDVIRKNSNGLPVRIIFEKRKGILPTVERLWKSATGDIILKTDADSVLPRTWTEHAVGHFEKDSQLAACTGPILAADGSGILKILITSGYVIGTVLYTVFKGYIPLFGPNGAFRKSALLRVGGYTSPAYDLDDQIISRKLAAGKLKVRWFPDMYNFHSTRRYQHRPAAVIHVILSFVHPRYYNEKQ